MEPIFLVPLTFITGLTLMLVVLNNRASAKDPPLRLAAHDLRLRCTRVLEAGDHFGEVAVELPRPLRLPTEAHVEHHPGLAEMGWTRAWLHGDPDEDFALLEFDGSDRWRLLGDARSMPRSGDVGPQKVEGPVPRYRILVKLNPGELALGFAHVTSPERLERIGQAVGALVQALLDEQERPFRELAATHGLQHSPGRVQGSIDGVEVHLERTDDRLDLRLDFPSSLPLGFEARRGQPLAAGSRFDNPVLDMLLTVKNPPQDQRFDDPRAAEICLKLLHGLPGSRLQKHRLELPLPDLDEAPELLDEALELVRLVSRP